MVERGDAKGYYMQDFIKEAIVNHARDREIGVRYNDFFGKRPDVLVYPNDVAENAKNNASSFHVSEEIWANPLQIATGMKKAEMNALRTGWDLIIDIDCPIWEYSKIITHLIVKGLQAHNITSVSVKFSGNKGFHIGVPFEAFPEVFQEQETRYLFPEAPRRIAQYLIDYINGPEMKFALSRELLGSGSIKRVAEITGKDPDELTQKICMHCGADFPPDETEDLIIFVCPMCQIQEQFTERIEYHKCTKCDILMERQVIKEKGARCGQCGSREFVRKFDPLPIIEVDTLLISSRHLYRMPYSLHEKSGLLSLPFNPEKIMQFEKKFADPSDLTEARYTFLDTTNTHAGEATMLLEKAWSYMQLKQEAAALKKGKERVFSGPRTVEKMGEQIPLECFPPCIHAMLKGMEDGKKRAQFIYQNFLSCVGYGWDEIEDLIDKWNATNPEPLREVLVKGSIRHHSSKKDLMLPPNCNNKGYYQDLGICQPDGLCKYVKNPVQYAKKKFEQYKENEKKAAKAKKQQEKAAKKSQSSSSNPSNANSMPEGNSVE